VYSAGLAPHQSEVLAAAVFAHPAEAALSILDQALLGAKLALHPLVLEFLPEPRWVRSWRLPRECLSWLEKD
jgi:hypothetical protein